MEMYFHIVYYLHVYLHALFGFNLLSLHNPQNILALS